MPLYTYTGTLLDLGLDALVGQSPRLRIRPEREAMSEHGLVSKAPVDVFVDGAGAFTVQLLSSYDLEPVARYVIEVGRYAEAFDGQRFVGVDTWVFLAAAGGGSIADGDPSPYAVFVGPPVAPWPVGTPPGLYIDPTPPNAWGIKEA
jgi:hypothetical protein